MNRDFLVDLNPTLPFSAAQARTVIDSIKLAHNALEDADFTQGENNARAIVGVNDKDCTVKVENASVDTTRLLFLSIDNGFRIDIRQHSLNGPCSYTTDIKGPYPKDLARTILETTQSALEGSMDTERLASPIMDLVRDRARAVACLAVDNGAIENLSPISIAPSPFQPAKAEGATDTKIWGPVIDTAKLEKLWDGLPVTCSVGMWHENGIPHVSISALLIQWNGADPMTRMRLLGSVSV